MKSLQELKIKPHPKVMNTLIWVNILSIVLSYFSAANDWHTAIRFAVNLPILFTSFLILLSNFKIWDLQEFEYGEPAQKLAVGSEEEARNWFEGREWYIAYKERSVICQSSNGQIKECFSYDEAKQFYKQNQP